MERVLRRGHRCFIFMTRRPTVSCPAAQQQRNDAVQKRAFGRTSPLAILKPYLLADIGEGIVECQIISWFVKPGDHIQQFERICEAQSDKASVEITSPFDGVVHKLHYDVDEMAKVGSPLIDIDVDEPTQIENTPNIPRSYNEQEVTQPFDSSQSCSQVDNITPNDPPLFSASAEQSRKLALNSSHTMLPSVRMMLKQYNLDMAEITPTGKGGRLLKEDIKKHIAAVHSPKEGRAYEDHSPRQTYRQDERQILSPSQLQMFKSMTRASGIPHLYYTHMVDVTEITSLRKNYKYESTGADIGKESPEHHKRLKALPIILKVLSQAFLNFPNMNANLNVETPAAQPELIWIASHNFGIAIDTPNGLLVPVIKGVENHSILSLADEINRLSTLARTNELMPHDFHGASFVVSNIGSLGGHTVGPVILPPMVGILAIGKSERVPSVLVDAVGGEHIRIREKVSFNWSADHRVMDGATVARCAKFVTSCLEDISAFGLTLR